MHNTVLSINIITHIFVLWHYFHYDLIKNVENLYYDTENNPIIKRQPIKFLNNLRHFCGSITKLL